MENKIWVELAPHNGSVRFANEQCRLANNMFARLIGGHTADTSDTAKFFCRSIRGVYCYGGGFGYEELPDRGKWFNLDFMGRELDKAATTK